MLLSPKNKIGNSFNFNLQKSISCWEPSLEEPYNQDINTLA